MNEYISREAVMSKCNDIWDNADETTQTGVDTINTIDEITDFIESLPSADVQPVRHGHWIGVDYDTFFECSECKNMTDWQRYKYCPYCGARMDLGDDENDG